MCTLVVPFFCLDAMFFIELDVKRSFAKVFSTCPISNNVVYINPGEIDGSALIIEIGP